MRYINQEDLTLPRGWQHKAHKAFNKLKTLSPLERKKAIKKGNNIWKDIKAPLLDCSGGKCWYCESDVAAVASADIDHFRPKNEVYNCPQHPGYWWLAFDWRNFRYSCELCNRQNTDPKTNFTGGKTSHFPLWDETKRCYDETDFAALLAEEPLLLDPICEQDTRLLTFDEQGYAQPTLSQVNAPREYKRARESINIYHLNRHHLVKKRQFMVCDKVQRFIRNAQKHLIRYQRDGSESALEAYNDAIEHLIDMIEERAEYSSTARAIMKLHADSEHEWLQELLLEA